jgi:hypothetical protein
MARLNFSTPLRPLIARKALEETKMMKVGLATIYHDPQGRLCDQAAKVLPLLTSIFTDIAINATATTHPKLLAHFADVAVIQQDDPRQNLQSSKIGRARKAAIALALQMDCSFILYCDSDRILHWAEYHPQELRQVVQQLCAHDLTVLGRTQRAFETHPRTMQDTEAIVNHVFKLISGYDWDVLGAARGLSRPAVEAIVAGCFDEEFSTDVSWPLFLLQQQDNLSFNYIATEGLEYETADRYSQEAAATGGNEQWLAQMEQDPRVWAHRLEAAQIQIAAMLPYVPEAG